jgi:DNA-binding transcriptional regulator YiaG
MFDADRAGESQEDEADTGEPDRAGEPEEDTQEADRPHEPEADKKAAARRLRADHPDLTQKDIASRLEVTDRTVRRWLNPPAPARALVTANGHSARTHEES